MISEASWLQSVTKKWNVVKQFPHFCCRWFVITGNQNWSWSLIKIIRGAVRGKYSPCTHDYLVPPVHFTRHCFTKRKCVRAWSCHSLQVWKPGIPLKFTITSPFTLVQPISKEPDQTVVRAHTHTHTHHPIPLLGNGALPNLNSQFA